MNEPLILSAFSQYKSKISTLDKQREDLTRQLEDGFREIAKAIPMNSSHKPVTDVLNVQSDAFVPGESICTVINTLKGVFYLSNLSRLFALQNNKLLLLEATEFNFNLLSEMEKNIIMSVCEQMNNRRPTIDLVDIMTYICDKQDSAQKAAKDWQKANIERLNKISAEHLEMSKSLTSRTLTFEKERVAFEAEKKAFMIEKSKNSKVLLNEKKDVSNVAEQLLENHEPHLDTKTIVDIEKND